MVANTRARSRAQDSEVSPAQNPAIVAPKAPCKITKVAKPIAKKMSNKASIVQKQLNKRKSAALNSTKPNTTTKREKAPDAQLSPRSRCLAGGPKGPKVYDDLGFELSYEACAGISRGWTRRPRGMSYYDMEDKRDLERARKREIMGTRREYVSALTYMAWDDRVARELGIPYHKVEMKHFEELASRGFIGKEGEFEAVNMSEEERERLSRLCTGAAFRA